MYLVFYSKMLTVSNNDHDYINFSINFYIFSYMAPSVSLVTSDPYNIRRVNPLQSRDGNSISLLVLT